LVSVTSLVSSLDFLLLSLGLSVGLHVDIPLFGDGVDLLALGLSGRLGLVGSLGCGLLGSRLSGSGSLGSRLVRGLGGRLVSRRSSSLGRSGLLASGFLSGSLGRSRLSSSLG
jgi:hypothetical protein